MSETERWKDRVEMSLDGRQIFFLFFGSAVAACLIFVAGVLVGKRMEQRALGAATPVAEDPLTELDRLDYLCESDDFPSRDTLGNEHRRKRDDSAGDRSADR